LISSAFKRWPVKRLKRGFDSFERDVVVLSTRIEPDLDFVERIPVRSALDDALKLI
jgi:hypothetical protein